MYQFEIQWGFVDNNFKKSWKKSRVVVYAQDWREAKQKARDLLDDPWEDQKTFVFKLISVVECREN